MDKENFQISIDAQRVAFTAPPIFKAGKWFVTSGKQFAKQLGLKVEYPAGTEMVVLCGRKGIRIMRAAPIPGWRKGCYGDWRHSLMRVQRASLNLSVLKSTKYQQTN